MKVFPGRGARELATWPAHPKGICALAWSPDGAVLASGGNDGVIRLWRAVGGGLIRSIEGHANSVRSIDWSPDGTYLLSGAEDGRVCAWDARDGRLILEHRDHRAWVSSVRHALDGRRYASASGDRTLIVYDARDHRPMVRLRSPFGNFMTIAWSDDGLLLAAAARTDEVMVWQTLDWQILRRIRTDGGVVWNVEWRPGTRELACCGQAGRIALLDVETGACRLLIEGHADTVARVVFPALGRILASLSHDETIGLWSMTGPQAIGRIAPIYPGWAYCLASHPTKPILASGNPDGRAVQLWSIAPALTAPCYGGRPDTAVLENHPGRVISPVLKAIKEKILDCKAKGCLTVRQDTVAAAVQNPCGNGGRLKRLVRSAALQLAHDREVRILGAEGRLFLRPRDLGYLASAVTELARTAPQGDGSVRLSRLTDETIAAFCSTTLIDAAAERDWIEAALIGHFVDNHLGFYRPEAEEHMLYLPGSATKPPPAFAVPSGPRLRWSLPGCPADAAARLPVTLLNSMLFSGFCLFRDTLFLRSGQGLAVQVRFRQEGADLCLFGYRNPGDEAFHLMADALAALAGIPEPCPASDLAPSLRDLDSLPWVLTIGADDLPASIPLAPQDVVASMLERAEDERLRQKRLCVLPKRRQANEPHLFVCHLPQDIGWAELLRAELAAHGLLAWIDPDAQLMRPEANPGLVALAEKVGVVSLLVGAAMDKPWTGHGFGPFYRALTGIQSPGSPRLRWLPILLPEAPASPDLPDFLHGFDWLRWVDAPHPARNDALAALTAAILVDRSRS